MRVGKYQCHDVDVDPMPELPLDKEIWGGPVHLKTPQSSYMSQFQNPVQVLQ